VQVLLHVGRDRDGNRRLGEIAVLNAEELTTMLDGRGAA
jgi:hypothetical protein